MVSRQRDPALHLDANGDLSQAFRDRMRRQTPPSDEPGDALLAARVAALEDGLAVACAAIAHLKGLAESKRRQNLEDCAIDKLGGARTAHHGGVAPGKRWIPWRDRL